MQLSKPKTGFLPLLVAVSVSVILLTFPIGLFPASGTSITMVSHYPVDGEKYELVDHFLEQTTEVNINTTVSVSIDNGTLIPMMYQGVRNEIVAGDAVAREWYTWSTTIPAITEPGLHTFQFFRQYCVWQTADQYWADFNSQSTIMSFEIKPSSSISPSPSSTPSSSPTPTSTPPVEPYPKTTASTNPSTVLETVIPALTMTAIVGSVVAVSIVLAVVAFRKLVESRKKLSSLYTRN